MFCLWTCCDWSWERGNKILYTFPIHSYKSIRFILDSDQGGIFPRELFITLSWQSRVSLAFHPNVLEASSRVPFPVRAARVEALKERLRGRLAYQWFHIRKYIGSSKKLHPSASIRRFNTWAYTLGVSANELNCFQKSINFLFCFKDWVRTEQNRPICRERSVTTSSLSPL